MKLKKFDQFVKNINEEFIPNEFDKVDDLKNHVADEFSEEDYDLGDDDDDDTEEIGGKLKDDFVVDDDDFVNDDDDDDDFSGEEEEEGHEYEGTKKLNDLAQRLGSEVIDNEINYNGFKINYYSETEKFHIGKEKFKTVDEVIDFLDSKEKNSEVEEVSTLAESRKYIKRY